MSALETPAFAGPVLGLERDGLRQPIAVGCHLCCLIIHAGHAMTCLPACRCPAGAWLALSWTTALVTTLSSPAAWDGC